MSAPAAPAWLEVDLGALRRNAEALMRRAGVPLIPMIKANAYGLGAAAVAKALGPVEPLAFGVATVREAEELRSAGERRPILVFTPLLIDEFEAAHRAGLTPTLGSGAAIRAWSRFQKPWHLSIDTGMSRAGVQWRDIAAILPDIQAYPPAGAFTHFHSPWRNDGTMDDQEARFVTALAHLPHRPPLVHLESSAAIVRRPQSRWDAVRPGIFLYGVHSGPGSELEPEPVVSMRARVAEVRWIEPGDSVSYEPTSRVESRRRIATIPLGYADGYPRALSGTGRVLVRGASVGIAGVVTMDMIMLDVTDVQCEPGDVVTLLGRDSHGGHLSVAEAADKASMSAYELLTGLNARLIRVFTESAS